LKQISGECDQRKHRIMNDKLSMLNCSFEVNIHHYTFHIAWGTNA
jgi:hypothetical protein